jgi:hypothetical protein
MSPSGGGWWRLALGVIAFAALAAGNLALVGLPLAALLLAAGPRGSREWLAVCVAAVLGATGFPLAGRGLLPAVIDAYVVLVTVAFVGIARLSPAPPPPPFLRMALRAMLWATAGVAGLVWVVWGGLAFRALRVESFHEAVAAMRALIAWQPSAAPFFESIVAFVSGTVPALLALETLAGLALAWELHVRLARRPLGAPLAPFRQFRFGDHWIWGVVGTITVWLVPALAALKTTAVNLSIVLGALYLLRGAAIVVALAAATGVSTLALVAGAVAATVLMIPLLFILPGLWTLGVTDTWMQFRRRLASRPTHTRG